MSRSIRGRSFSRRSREISAVGSGNAGPTPAYWGATPAPHSPLRSDHASCEASRVRWPAPLRSASTADRCSPAGQPRPGLLRLVRPGANVSLCRRGCRSHWRHGQHEIAPMILSIESSLSTFKTVRFQGGLNVLLADTQPGSTEKQTRNSAGKTSLLEIIHFLMGSNCDKDSLFRTAALIEHTFTGAFIIAGEQFTIQRGGAEPSKIFLLAGGEDRDDLPKRTDKSSGRLFVSNTNWRVFLGHALFAMPGDVNGTAFEDPGTPSFRALFAYFVRRRDSGAFLYPERQAEQQQRGDWQVNLSYLLGLGWQIPFQFQKVRGRERTLEELKKAAKGGAFGEVMGTVAELRPQVIVAETRAAKLRTQLANFEVLDSYRDLSRRAAKAKLDMQALGRESVGLHETLGHLERALAVEAPPAKTDVQKLYTDSGIELPGIALRRFDEVNQFYDSVVQNRRAHLQHEIAETRRRVAENESSLASLDIERRDLLQTLEGRGALEDFVNLQRELANLEA